jgi:hypothetical protein
MRSLFSSLLESVKTVFEKNTFVRGVVLKKSLHSFSLFFTEVFIIKISLLFTIELNI